MAETSPTIVQQMKQFFGAPGYPPVTAQELLALKKAPDSQDRHSEGVGGYSAYAEIAGGIKDGTYTY